MTDEEIKGILERARTVAVVGLSDKPDRESHSVAKYLMEQGYRIIPVNPMIDEALGLRSYASLRDIDEPVDIVDIFRRPDAVPPIVDEAIEIGARVVWMQLGIVNDEAAQKAEDAGLTVVMDRCMKIEHKRLMGESTEHQEGTR